MNKIQNSVRRAETVGPNLSWGGRARRAYPAVAVFLSVTLIAATGLVVGIFYASNLLQGHTTVDTKLGITGTLPTNYIIGVTQVSTIQVVSYADGALNAYLVLGLTGGSGNATVTVAGNDIQPACVPDRCTWTGLPFVLPGRGNVPVDVGVTFLQAGGFDWSVQAFAS